MHVRNIPKEKVGRFLETAGTRLLLYDADPDGTTSAALLLKFFPDFEPVPRRGPRMEEKFLEELIKKKPALMVFLDMQIDQERDKLLVLQQKCPLVRTLIIDHHKPEHDMNGDRIIHINPVLVEDVYQPTAYLTYRLLERLGKEAAPHLWIAAIGVIADYAFHTCADLLDEAAQRFPASLAGDPRASPLGVAGEMISAVITVEGMEGAQKALKILRQADRPEQVTGAPLLTDARKLVDKEFGMVKRDCEEHKEETGPFVFFEIEAKYNLVSRLSTLLAERWPGKIIIIRKKCEEGWKLSGRCQSGRIHLGEIFKKAARGIGSGGGHKKAAGAQVSDWEEFRKRVMEAVVAQVYLHSTKEAGSR